MIEDKNKYHRMEFTNMFPMFIDGTTEFYRIYNWVVENTKEFDITVIMRPHNKYDENDKVSCKIIPSGNTDEIHHYIQKYYIIENFIIFINENDFTLFSFTFNGDFKPNESI